MFGKKKKSEVKHNGKANSQSTSKAKPKTKLSPEVAQADKLRLAAKRAGKKDTVLRKTAYAEFRAAKTDKQKDEVRKKYKDQLQQLKLEADIAYTTYENYIKENFDSGVVQSILVPNGDASCVRSSFEKQFINDLQSAENSKKQGIKTSTSVPQANIIKVQKKPVTYTVFDTRKGKTFATEEEARAYEAQFRKKTGIFVSVERTQRNVTHTFGVTKK